MRTRSSQPLCAVQFVFDVDLLLVSQPQRAVQFFVALPSLQQAFGLEPLEVGQVAQRAEAERLQKFPRRHIGEGGAGLRRADGAVDQAVALERGDDVAADLAPREPGNLTSGDRLQIGDRGEDKALCPSQVRNLVPSPSGMGGANRRREARLVRNA